MDFRFTDEQQDLIDAAKTVFDGVNTCERMRAIVNGEVVFDIWEQLGELGLLGFMAPEEIGGLDQSLVAMTGAAEAAGYANLSDPFVELAGITLPILLQLNEKDAVQKITAGKLKIGLLTPLLPFVNQAEHCDQFLVLDSEGGKLINKTEVKCEPRKSIDPLRSLWQANIEGTHNMLADKHGAVLTAAELVGLSTRMVDMSVKYAKDRHQFGKPIGSFQAIKHQLATVYTQIEFTRPMVHLAALKGGRAVHAARIAAIDTVQLAAETAIQVHGGMGYTYEVDLHLFMKRAWALCGIWGSKNYHMQKLENLILGGNETIGAGTTFI